MYETQGTASLTHPQRAQLALYIQQQAQFAGLTSITLAQQTTLEQQYLRLLAQHLEQQRALHQQQQQPQQVQPQVAPPKPKQATPIAVAPSPPKPEFVCALCPDLNTEGLVAIGEAEGKSKKKLQAHRICASIPLVSSLDRIAANLISLLIVQVMFTRKLLLLSSRRPIQIDR